MVEIKKELDDLEKQRQAADAKLVEHFRSAFQMAEQRENDVRKSLETVTAQDLKLNEAATQALVMMQEARTSGELYSRVEGKVEEASLNAGVHSSHISVVDSAREPAKAAAPDLPVYMTITFFIGLWLAVGCVLAVESMSSAGRVTATFLAMVVVASAMAHGQPPTPTTSGLPSGVAHPITTEENRARGIGQVDAQATDAAANAMQAANPGTNPATNVSGGLVESPMAAPIGPGDFLECQSSTCRSFDGSAGVCGGTVTLPMVNEVRLEGIDEAGVAESENRGGAGCERNAAASAGGGTCDGPMRAKM